MYHSLRSFPQYGILLISCIFSLSNAIANTDFPSEPVTPDWLIKNTMAEGFWGAQNMTLENGSIYLSAPSAAKEDMPTMTTKNMTLENGGITMDWVDAMDKPGMYISGTSSELNPGLRFFVCRDCVLVDNESGESFSHNGLVFGKRNFTMTDLYSVPHPMHVPNEAYVFADEKTLKVSALPGGEREHTKLAYLKELGYDDYLDLPVRTVLRDKAAAGDTKAQVVYAIYWIVNTIYDPAGRGFNAFSSIIKAAERNNPDVLLFLGMHFASNEETIQLYKEAKADRPRAGAMLTDLLWKQSQPDMQAICQLSVDASKDGISGAQLTYSYCLYNGEGGVKQDRQLAEAYMALASVNGLDVATQSFIDCAVSLPKVEQGQLVYTSCLEE